MSNLNIDNYGRDLEEFPQGKTGEWVKGLNGEKLKAAVKGADNFLQEECRRLAANAANPPTE